MLNTNKVPFLMVGFFISSSPELSSSELDFAFLTRVFLAPGKHLLKSHNTISLMMHYEEFMNMGKSQEKLKNFMDNFQVKECGKVWRQGKK